MTPAPAPTPDVASTSGNAPFALSVLDNAHTGVGQTVSEAFGAVIELARLADRRGLRRFWMSEHHAMPGASTSSPQLMVARLIAETERIRLGAGGVMLPNHAPLVIAEQFGQPKRLRLGAGRRGGAGAGNGPGHRGRAPASSRGE